MCAENRLRLRMYTVFCRGHTYMCDAENRLCTRMHINTHTPWVCVCRWVYMRVVVYAAYTLPLSLSLSLSLTHTHTHTHTQTHIHTHTQEPWHCTLCAWRYTPPTSASPPLSSVSPPRKLPERIQPAGEKNEKSVPSIFTTLSDQTADVSEFQPPHSTAKISAAASLPPPQPHRRRPRLLRGIWRSGKGGCRPRRAEVRACAGWGS